MEQLRRGLELHHKRLLWIEQHVQSDTQLLSDEQSELLKRDNVDFRCSAIIPRGLTVSGSIAVYIVAYR